MKERSEAMKPMHKGKDQEGKAIKWMCDYFNSTWCNIWWEWSEPNVTWLYPLPNSPQTPPILNFVEEIAQLQERLNRLQELHNQLQEWSLVFSYMNVQPKDEAIVTTITKITLILI